MCYSLLKKINRIFLRGNTDCCTQNIAVGNRLLELLFCFCFIYSYFLYLHCCCIVGIVRCFYFHEYYYGIRYLFVH